MMTMTMIKLRKLFLFIFLFLFLGVLNLTIIGQETDFQTRFEVELEKKFKKFDLTLSLEQLFNQNSLRYDRSMLTLVGQVDIIKDLSLNAGVRWMLVQDIELEFENRFRANIDLTYKRDIEEFYIGIRSRTQYGFDDQIFYKYFRDNRLVTRLRLEGGYHIFGTRFTPSVGIEPYLHLNHYDGAQFYKMRYSVGTKYDINNANSLELNWLYEDEFNVVYPINASIIWLTYKFQF